jgi:hypothetical protein
MKTMNLEKVTNEELISQRIEIDKEFKRRRIKFNVGDIGEVMAINYFNKTPGLSNLQKAPTGTKNVDALSRSGERYSIKTIKDGNKTGTVYPDKTDKDTQLFEYLLLVQINDDYELFSLHRFSWKQFTRVKQWDKTMNAWYISKSQKTLKQGEVIYEK